MLFAGEVTISAKEINEEHRRKMAAEVKNFASPDETRPFEGKGQAKAVELAGHTVLFVTAGHLLGDLAALDSDSTLRRRLRHYAAPDVLLIDEVGYLSYSNRLADLLFELVSRRYQHKSTVFTTNKAFADWGEVFPNAACVVSLVDRLMHRAELVRIEGESYRAKEAQERLAARAIFAHLGNGASLCALRNGISIDTTMGLTPTGGIPMGTRSGDLDPGVILFLIRNQKFDADTLEDLLNHKSGLSGLSSGESDVKALEERARSGDAKAALALDVFAVSVRKMIGAYAALLGGVDLLVFTGGIGEHSERIRSAATGEPRTSRPRCSRSPGSSSRPARPTIPGSAARRSTRCGCTTTGSGATAIPTATG